MNSLLTNPIVQIDWAGWRSDTLTLQRHGWEVLVEQDIYPGTIRIALQHREAQVQGITEWIQGINFMSVIESGYDRLPIFRARLYHKIIINLMETTFNFEPVDAQPRLFEGERKEMSDFNIFQPIKAQEIISDPAEVNDLMEQILELQSPKQRELREKARRENRKLQRQVHAQVITLAA